jgi:uncharacterized protein YjbI with pentapeptide repeats
VLASVFRRAKHDGAILHEAKLERSTFDEVSAARADFTKATLRGCLCIKWKAHAIKLESATLERVAFNGSDLSEGQMTEVIAERCSFMKATLTKCIFTRANLAGAVFFDADLSHANLKAACLRGARLVDAILDHVDAAKADLFEADLSYSSMHEASFVDANAFGANFTGAGGKGTSLSGANLMRSLPESP